MNLRSEHVAVACRNANGSPAMVCYEVDVTDEEYENGDHYRKAYALASNDGYEGRYFGYDNSEHAEIIAMGEYLQELAES